MKKADVEANLKTLERRKKNMEETLERLEEDDDVCCIEVGNVCKCNSVLNRVMMKWRPVRVELRR
eukprot:m.38665 g.38665  ORF g.38665 m.38665 type:complete len:65 (+) comp32622_c0_seq4:658-852(+)